MKHAHRISVALGFAAALAISTAAAQQGSMPPGHPPVQPLPVDKSGGIQLPDRVLGVQPGRPVGPGGRQLPPGHGFQRQGGMGPGRPHRAAVAEEDHGGGHGEQVCPGHGPMDPPHHVNWWRGLIGVNNEAADKGGLSSLLWRYHNDKDPCDPKNEPPPFLASLLNFGLLAFIVVRFGRKPIAEALKKRKQTIMQDIEAASQLKADAEKRLQEYEDKLERTEETLAQLKAEYATQAELEKQHVLTEAEQRRARMKRDAEFRVEQELKAARALLLEEAVRGATAAAEEMLRQRVTKEDLDRVGEEYLKAISTSLSASGAVRTQTTGAAT